MSLEAEADKLCFRKTERIVSACFSCSDKPVGLENISTGSSSSSLECVLYELSDEDVMSLDEES